MGLLMAKKPEEHTAPAAELADPKIITQGCIKALVAAGQGGTGYALNDTITLAAGVVVKATTMTADAVASVTIINPGSSTSPPANPVAQVSTSGAGTGAKFNLTWAAVFDVFPGFTPIFPPPLVGQGGGAPPNFPPPTPPPIGTVPVGPLVGPVVAAAAVPPSFAGYPLIKYQTGSATVPAQPGGYFPKFTSTFPSPTIVFSNVYTGGKPPSTPPNTASTLNIVLDGWGPNVPAGAPTTPGGDGRFPRSLTLVRETPPEPEPKPAHKEEAAKSRRKAA
jgi:hypothetical protein